MCPNRDDGRKDRVSMSRESCMSRAGMDRSRAMNLENLDRMGVSACIWDSCVMMHGDAGEDDVGGCDGSSDRE